MQQSNDEMDKVRERLKVDSLDTDSRQQVFHELVEAGGQVVRLQPKHKEIAKKAGTSSSVQPTDATKNLASPVNQNMRHVRSAETLEQKREISKLKGMQQQQGLQLGRKIYAFMATWSAFTDGVISFNGKKIKPALVKLAVDMYPLNVLHAHVLITRILPFVRADAIPSVFPKVVAVTDPNYLELVYRVTLLHNENFLRRLDTLRVQRQVQKAAPILLELYRALSVLQPYYAALEVGCEKTLMLANEVYHLERDPKTVIYTLRKRLTPIFLKLYPKLSSFVHCYLVQARVQRPDLQMYDLIGYGPQDQVGYWVEQWKAQMKTVDVVETPTPEPEDVASQDQMKEEAEVYGMEFIRHALQYYVLSEEMYRFGFPKQLCSADDKFLIAFLLENVFDAQFSFLATTAGLDMTPVLEFGRRMDHRQSLSDAFMALNLLHDRLLPYQRLLASAERKTELNTRQQERLQKEHEQFSFGFRQDMRNALTKIMDTVDVLMSVERTHAGTIRNFTDTIKRNEPGFSFCTGMSFEEAVDAMYAVSLALVHVLAYGELSGKNPYRTTHELPVQATQEEGAKRPLAVEPEAWEASPFSDTDEVETDSQDT